MTGDHVTGAGFPDIVTLEAFDKKLGEDNKRGNCVHPDGRLFFRSAPSRGILRDLHKPRSSGSDVPATVVVR